MSPLRFVLPLVLLISTSFANAYSFKVNRSGADLRISFDSVILRVAVLDVVESLLGHRAPGARLTLARVIAGAVARLDDAIVVNGFFERVPEVSELEIEAAIKERVERVERGELTLF